MVRLQIILSLLVSACRSRTENHLSVSNAQLAGDRFPEVVKLATRDLSGSSAYCSGVFIRPRLLLTAAHCTYSKQGTGGASISYIDTNGVMHQGKMYPSRRYNYDGDTVYNVRHDLALILFDTDVAPAVARIAQTPPDSGETVTIVGFGRTDPADKKSRGTKTFGFNIIQSRESNISKMTGPAEINTNGPSGPVSLPMRGDSGCGIFNQRGELSGIHSAGGKITRDALGNGLKDSYHVDITHPKSLALFREIDADVCAGKSLQPGEACQSGVCSIQ